MRKKPRAVRVFAPATVANVCVGFDVLGFALEKPGDEIVARWGNNPGLRITQIHGANKELPKEITKNTAGFGANELLKSLGMEDEPIELEIYKKMPFGSGMGSSAASAAGGVLAVNELLGRPLSKDELVKYAVLGESAADGAIHGDNVIPALCGGLVLIRDNARFDYIKLPVPRGITVVLIYPDIEILTKEARAVLSKDVSLDQLIRQTGNMGSFVASLYLNDLELMAKSLSDHVIEPQRASLIPFFYDMQKIALSCGAMNYSISGAGPSMFAFCQNTVVAEAVSSSIIDFLSSKNIDSCAFHSAINTKGAFLM
jgi:homoserine kinase